MTRQRTATINGLRGTKDVSYRVAYDLDSASFVYNGKRYELEDGGRWVTLDGKRPSTLVSAAWIEFEAEGADER